jgi:hypothetical protein
MTAPPKESARCSGIANPTLRDAIDKRRQEFEAKPRKTRKGKSKSASST